MRLELAALLVVALAASSCAHTYAECRPDGTLITSEATVFRVADQIALCDRADLDDGVRVVHARHEEMSSGLAGLAGAAIARAADLYGWIKGVIP
jgi:hypothetical protein